MGSVCGSGRMSVPGTKYRGDPPAELTNVLYLIERAPLWGCFHFDLRSKDLQLWAPSGFVIGELELRTNEVRVFGPGEWIEIFKKSLNPRLRF